MDDEQIATLEAALLASGRPVSVDELTRLFEEAAEPPGRTEIREAVEALNQRWEGHALEVVEVATGYRAQIRREFSSRIASLWQERPARYSRALLETLALVTYRQPISRGEIEDIRGVSVSSSIMKTLLEREWVRVVGHREVPGRPALYGTTRQFLDSFNLKSLQDLPALKELKDLDDVHPDLFASVEVVTDGEEGGDAEALAPRVGLGLASGDEDAGPAGSDEASGDTDADADADGDRAADESAAETPDLAADGVSGPPASDQAAEPSVEGNEAPRPEFESDPPDAARAGTEATPALAVDAPVEDAGGPALPGGPQGETPAGELDTTEAGSDREEEERPPDRA